MADREYDIVLFGATGFAGALTAAYLAEHAPAKARIALAARSHEKLAALGIDLPLLVADSSDAESIDRLARSTRVLVTTVGPYAIHGESLVKACAEHGTHYLDLAGEPGFVDEMYLKYDAPAKQSGARLIHSAGFDSVPHDLGAYFTVLQLPEDVPITVESRVWANGQYSGGTVQSALNGFAHARQTLTAAHRRAKAEPKPVGRKIGRVIRPPHRDRAIGKWVGPLPTIDQLVVERSAAANDRYGPDFRYGHNFAAEQLRSVVSGVAVVTSTFLLAQIPPARRQLLKRFPSGSGPSEERRAESRFRVEFIGKGGEKTVRTAISGGDAGYGETAKMLAECAFAVAFDDIPDLAGQLTPVTAIGDSLLERLPNAGIPLEVV